jgi:hypothetical protein
MNIATINDTLLPVVLFVIYFVFVSVVRYNLKELPSISKDKEVSKTSEEPPKSFTYRDAFSAEFNPDPERAIARSSAPSAIAPEIVVSVELENKEEVETPISPQVLTDDEFIDAPTTTHSNHQSIPEIIDGLGKRDIRKLCAPLGIKQKTNGTELTTELMKALVKRKYKENPVQVMEVMSDRLSERMLTLSPVKQHKAIDKKAG